MRLNRVHIENFRALESMDISLHPMSVIIGENDVGKTSCMLAIRTLFECRKLDNAADFFKNDRAREVLIEAGFICAAPTPEQLPFRHPDSQEVVVRCTYTFNENRKAQIRQLVPQRMDLRDLSSKGVAKLHELIVELNLAGGLNAKKILKPDALALLTEYLAGLSIDEKTDEWVSISDTDLIKVLPDFILVPVARDLESCTRMTDASLLGKVFRPILKTALDEVLASNALIDVKAKLKGSVDNHVQDLQVLLQEQMNNESLALKHFVDLDPIKGLGFVGNVLLARDAWLAHTGVLGWVVSRPRRARSCYGISFRMNNGT